jgi:amino acid permease
MLLHVLAAGTVLTVLVAFHVVLIVLWVKQASLLDRHSFDVARLSEITQIISVVSQAWIVLSLAVFSFVVQSVVADRIIRRRKHGSRLRTHLGY